MKRNTVLILFAAVALSFTSCGNKTDNNADSSDSTTIQSEKVETTDSSDMEADGVDTAPADQWTEEAVAQQIKKIYAEVSKVYTPSADGMENNTDLDGMFCTNDFNELQCQIRVINAKKRADDRRFDNEQMRWTYGMDAPFTPQNIKVELLTGNMAEATFELHSGEQWLYTKLGLDWEDGQWKISSWKEVGDNNSDLFDEMFNYVEANK